MNYLALFCMFMCGFFLGLARLVRHGDRRYRHGWNDCRNFHLRMEALRELGEFEEISELERMRRLP